MQVPISLTMHSQAAAGDLLTKNPKSQQAQVFDETCRTIISISFFFFKKAFVSTQPFHEY